MNTLRVDRSRFRLCLEGYFRLTRGCDPTNPVVAELLSCFLNRSFYVNEVRLTYLSSREARERVVDEQIDPLNLLNPFVLPSDVRDCRKFLNTA